MLLPHSVELPQLGAEILEGEAGLCLTQLAGSQLLLEGGHRGRRELLPLPPPLLLLLVQLLTQLPDRLLVLGLAQPDLQHHKAVGFFNKEIVSQDSYWKGQTHENLSKRDSLTRFFIKETVSRDS